MAADDPNLVTAFMNAHAAGDTAAAGVLAAEIQRQRTAAPAAPPAAAPPAAAPPPPSTFGSTLKGEGEVAGSALLNMPGAALNAGADLLSRVTGNGPRAKPLVPSIEPGAAGKQFLGDVGDIAKPVTSALASGAGAVNDAMGNSPAADVVRDVGHQAVGVGGDVASLLPFAGAAKGAAGLLTKAGEVSPATDLGYRAATSETGKLLAGDSAGPTLIHHNNAVAKMVVGSEAGLPAGTTPSYEALEAARAAPGAVLDRAGAALPAGGLDADAQAAIKNAGTPDGGRVSPGSPQAQEQIAALKAQLTNAGPDTTGTQWTNELRGLRQEGHVNVASDDVSNQQLGAAQLDMAGAIEGHIDRNLPTNAGVDMDQLLAARKALAKNYTATAALRGDRFDMNAIARTQRANPNLLDGDMKTTADFANANPEVVGNPSELNKPSVLGDLKNINLASPSSYMSAVTGALGRRILTGGAETLGNTADLVARGDPATAFAPKFNTVRPGADLPQQNELPLRSNMTLQPPLGNAPPLPSPRQQQPLGLGEALQLQHPPGDAPGVAPQEPMNQNQYQFGIHAPMPLDLQPPPGRVGLGNALLGSVDDITAAGQAHGKAAANGGKPEEKGLPTDMADRAREDKGLPPAGIADHAAIPQNALKEIVDNVRSTGLTLDDLKTGDGRPPNAMEQFLLALRKSQGK